MCYRRKIKLMETCTGYGQAKGGIRPRTLKPTNGGAAGPEQQYYN